MIRGLSGILVEIILAPIGVFAIICIHIIYIYVCVDIYIYIHIHYTNENVRTHKTHKHVVIQGPGKAQVNP